MTHRRLRTLVLAGGLLCLPGLWISLVDDDLDAGAPLLLVAGVLAGSVSCLRVRLVGPHALGDRDVPRVHRQRSVAGDLAWVAALLLVAGLAFTAVAVARGEDDGTIWIIPFVLALLGGGAALLGFLAGVLVLVPIVTLLALLVGRGPQPAARRDVLLCLLLPTTTAFATLMALSVDSEGPSRSFPVRSLPALLTGVDSAGAEVTSHALLWAARASLVVLVGLGVALVRTQRADRDGSPGEGAADDPR